jgi:hypothetical protein
MYVGPNVQKKNDLDPCARAEYALRRRYASSLTVISERSIIGSVFAGASWIAERQIALKYSNDCAPVHVYCGPYMWFSPSQSSAESSSTARCLPSSNRSSIR